MGIAGLIPGNVMPNLRAPPILGNPAGPNQLYNNSEQLLAAMPTTGNPVYPVTNSWKVLADRMAPVARPNVTRPSTDPIATKGEVRHELGQDVEDMEISGKQFIICETAVAGEFIHKIGDFNREKLQMYAIRVNNREVKFDNNVQICAGTEEANRLLMLWTKAHWRRNKIAPKKVINRAFDEKYHPCLSTLAEATKVLGLLGAEGDALGGTSRPAKMGDPNKSGFSEKKLRAEICKVYISTQQMLVANICVPGAKTSDHVYLVLMPVKRRNLCTFDVGGTPLSPQFTMTGDDGETTALENTSDPRCTIEFSDDPGAFAYFYQWQVITSQHGGFDPVHYCAPDITRKENFDAIMKYGKAFKPHYPCYAQHLGTVSNEAVYFRQVQPRKETVNMELASRDRSYRRRVLGNNAKEGNLYMIVHVSAPEYMS
jgi:hypothetical protein